MAAQYMYVDKCLYHPSDENSMAMGRPTWSQGPAPQQFPLFYLLLTHRELSIETWYWKYISSITLVLSRKLVHSLVWKNPSDCPTLLQIWQIPVPGIFLAKNQFLNIKTVLHFLHHKFRTLKPASNVFSLK